MEELGTLAKVKKGTWIQNCKESVKRETEVRVMADELQAMGKLDENTRAITRGREPFRKIEDKEEAAK